MNKQNMLLSLEVGVENFVPTGGELLKLSNSRRQSVQLAQAALTLLLNLLLDILGELLLEGQSLLGELVLKLLFVDLLLTLQKNAYSALVVFSDLLHLILKVLSPLVSGGLVELLDLFPDLQSSLPLELALHTLKLLSNLGDFTLGLVYGGAILAVSTVSVDDQNKVIDHVDEVLDNRLSGMLK
ncbi:hypothetical protein HG531_002067 [Fusarium graminearum]|nr:hypothetical protein HG531_002067 [Fusarium graminearum]